MTTARWDAAAHRLLTSFDRNMTLAPLSAEAALTLDEGYAVAGHITQARMARGESPVGRKIGFTNRTIWPIYNVDAPVWNWVWDSTLHDIPTDGRVVLPALPNLRLEPEVIFGIAHRPTPGMAPSELLACIDWVAHGVEIVTSVYPDWRFTAPDAAAAQAMHGALWVGPRRSAKDITVEALESFTLTLRGPDVTLGGKASDVLDGPLHALAHLIGEIPRLSGAGPIQPGEIITTGTLTDAAPIAAGQRWRTTLDGIDLPGLDITLV